jgi:hypothetical protein
VVHATTGRHAEIVVRYPATYPVEFQLHTGEQLNARITLQDARVFGETDTKGTSTGTLGYLRSMDGVAAF